MPKKAKEAQGIVLKGTREFRLDQFKLLPEKRMKNISHNTGRPMFTRDTHVHFYRSHNAKRGIETNLSTQTGLHYHKVEIEWETDEQGNETIKSAKCGPALHYIEVKGRDGQPVKKLAPIRWKQKAAADVSELEDDEIYDLDQDQFTWIYDRHTHEIEYQHSEFMNQNTIRDITNKNRKEASALIDRSQPSSQIAAVQKQQEAPTEAVQEIKV